MISFAVLAAHAADIPHLWGRSWGAGAGGVTYASTTLSMFSAFHPATGA